MFAQELVRVPARQTPVTRLQPNGDSITVILRGDEWHHYSITLDGYQILENDKGYIHYATLKRGEPAASRRLAHNAPDRSCCEQRWLTRHGIMKFTP